MEFYDIIESASTQYTDFKGSAAIDSHSGSELDKMAYDHGVPEEFMPVGWKLYAHEVHPGEDLPRKLILKVYAIERSQLGDGVDLVVHCEGRNKENPLPVHAFEIRIDPSKLDQYLKRVEIIVKRSHISDVPFGVVEMHDLSG